MMVQDLEQPNRECPALDPDPVQLARMTLDAQLLDGMFADNDLGAVVAIGGLDPGGEIHVIADHSVVHPLR